MSASGDSTRFGAELAERAAEICRELERVRFAGGNPVVDLPSGADPLELAARVMAAERSNALLRIAGRAYNPQEHRAAADLDRALGALRSGTFSAAQALLDAAGARAANPHLQQRIGLWKLLGQLVERLVTADPDEDLRGSPERWVLDYLAGADRLAPAEREHYRAEASRLAALHAAARAGERNEHGPLARTLWYLLRAQRALANDEPVVALTWCVRAARTNTDRLSPDEYLADLLDRGRRYVLLQLGEIPEEELAETREAVKGLQAWDLYHALVARLSQLHGLDAHRETARYAIAPYRDVSE